MSTQDLPGAADPGNRLTGWKKIAAYLQVSVRQAQTWEIEKRLPIHRLPGGSRARVYAYVHELDDWYVTREEPESSASPVSAPIALQPPAAHAPSAPRFGRDRRYAVAAGIALLILIAGALLLHQSRAGSANSLPSDYRVGPRELVALNRDAEPLWRFELPHPVLLGAYQGDEKPERFQIEDLDGDRYPEVLFAYHSTARASLGTALYCFHSDGALRWKFTPGRPLKTPTQEFAPTYYANRTLRFDDENVARVAVSSNHSAGYPNQVAILDSAGKLIGEYWHSGHLRHIAAADLDRDGRDDLILEGVNDGHGAATLVVFDPRNVRGASVQPPGDFRQLLGFSQGSEKAIVFFPKSCMSRLQAFNRAFQLEVGANFIRVFVAEGIRETDPYLVYELDFDLRVKSVMASSVFQTRHAELEAAGQLDHKLTQAEIDGFRNLNIVRKAW